MTQDIHTATEPQSAPGLSRRDALVLTVAATASAGTLAGREARAEGEPDHSKMDHGAMDHGAHGGAAKFESLIKSASDCIRTGEICAAHCIASGDPQLAACLKSVLTMMPMCDALVRLGALEAPRLKEVAKVCLAICEDCEKECKKHADKHATCKACMDSCTACAKECKAIVDA
jgi:Cys-rich four helix bundle protein (predicted Tat secretion target)